jgi:hypothetical protein
MSFLKRVIPGHMVSYLLILSNNLLSSMIHKKTLINFFKLKLDHSIVLYSSKSRNSFKDFDKISNEQAKLPNYKGAWKTLIFKIKTT